MRNLLPLFVLLTLFGCGSKGREALLQYRETFAQGEFDRAGSLLKKAHLEKEPKSQLLLLMETGRLAYAQGDFKTAIDQFTAATELIDAQYTKSITREGSKWLVNDASGEFFGATYERSWLFYHLALSHWRYYQEGKLPREEARTHLFSARAALLAWDSFFQDWQRGSGGKSLYRHDLAAKVVAGQVHEATGVRADLQISLQLYKDAWNLMNVLTPSFATFNSEAPKYLEVMEAALSDGNFSPPNKYKTDTPAAAQTREFLRDKIVSLTLQLRPGELPQVQQQLGLSNTELTTAKTVKQSNVTFILEEGTIPAKVGETIDIGLKGLASLSKDPKTQAQITKVGSDVFAAFAVETLGLGASGGGGGRYVMARDVTALAAREAAITFEVPTIAAQAPGQGLWLVVKSGDGKEALLRPWPVISPLTEIARQSLSEEAGQRILRTGVRLAMKHIAAIAAAMGTYYSLNKDGKNGFIAKVAAMGVYVAATKGIALTERADTRSWATLPKFLRLTDAQLPPGAYEVSMALKPDRNAPGDLRPLGKIEVVKGQRAIFTYLKPQY